MQTGSCLILKPTELLLTLERTGLDFWTPNINPFRDLSSYVHALIQGLQGDVSDPYKRVVATCKHFAGYDIEDWNGNLRYIQTISQAQAKLIPMF
jgi:beta-D-xylosidase 4